MPIPRHSIRRSATLIFFCLLFIVWSVSLIVSGSKESREIRRRSGLIEQIREAQDAHHDLVEWVLLQPDDPPGLSEWEKKEAVLRDAIEAIDLTGYPASPTARFITDGKSCLERASKLRGRGPSDNVAPEQLTRSIIDELHMCIDLLSLSLKEQNEALIAHSLNRSARWIPVATLGCAASILALTTIFLLLAKQRTDLNSEAVKRSLQVGREELVESEARFRAVCETVATAIFIIRGSRIRYANAAAARISGYSRDELLGREFWFNMHPDFKDVVRERGLERQQKGGGPAQYEVAIITKDGQTRWVEYIASTFEMEGELAILGTAYDLTDVRNAQSKLQERSREAESLHRISEIAVGARGFEEAAGEFAKTLTGVSGYRFASIEVYDPQQRTMTLISPTGLDLGGRRIRYEIPISKTLSGLAVDTALPVAVTNASHREENQDELLRAAGFETWISIPMIVREEVVGAITIADRDQLRIEEHLLRWLDSAQNLIAASFERARAERTLRLSEERYRALYDDNPTMFFSVNPDGVIQSVNRFGARQLGYTVEELTGTSVFDLFHPDDLPVLREQIAIAGEHPERLHHWEFRKKTKEGRIMWVREVVRVVSVSTYEREFFIMCEDITAEKATEEERVRLDAQLEYSQKMEGIALLASVIAHEFNNQLMVIMGNADLALLDIPDSSEAREALDQIRETVDAAGEMTKQLLVYAGEPSEESDLLNLSAILEKMDRLLHVAFSKKALLEVEFAGRIAGIRGNDTQMRQIVMNLVTNAVDALDGETGVITIRTGSEELRESRIASFRSRSDRPPGLYTYLEVSDTGGGIRGDEVELIFDPFFSGKKGGRGLGLFVVQEIVEKLGGAIEITSSTEKGTTLRTWFPSTGEWLESAEDSVNPAPAFEMWKGDDTILVVDDEKEIRSVASRILVRAGFHVDQAASGRECMEKVRSKVGRYSAILLDVTMSDLDGLETLGTLRETNPDMKVVLMSGYNEERNHGNSGPYSPDDYLKKPFHAVTLIRTIQTLLEDRA